MKRNWRIVKEYWLVVPGQGAIRKDTIVLFPEEVGPTGTVDIYANSGFSPKGLWLGTASSIEEADREILDLIEAIQPDWKGTKEDEFRPADC